MTQTPTQPKVLADNGDRAFALLLDLLLLLLLAYALSGLLESASVRLYLLWGVFVFYLVSMPLTALQATLGKWACRLKMCDRQGRRLGWRASLLRTVGVASWFSIPVLLVQVSSVGMALPQQLTEIWWLLCLLPWMFMGFMPRGESLFDLLAGSLVVSSKATADAIADAQVARKPAIVHGVGLLLVCLFVGFLVSTAVQMVHVKQMHGRVAYAIHETLPLRTSIEAFHAANQRWPRAADLGLADWNPYPDGGGYRLQDSGQVIISFTVLPELKGHSLRFVPTHTNAGSIQWQCSADAAFERSYLRSSCR